MFDFVKTLRNEFSDAETPVFGVVHLYSPIEVYSEISLYFRVGDFFRRARKNSTGGAVVGKEAARRV